MYKMQNNGVIIVRPVNPKELSNMDDNEVLIVNRIEISSRIVEFEIRSDNNKASMVLKNAFREMKQTEKKNRSIMLGAHMNVGEIKNVFPEYESLPESTSFFSLNRKTK